MQNKRMKLKTMKKKKMRRRRQCSVNRQVQGHSYGCGWYSLQGHCKIIEETQAQGYFDLEVFEADPNICNGFGTYVHLLLGFTLRLISASTAFMTRVHNYIRANIMSWRQSFFRRGALEAKYQKRCEIVNGVVEVEGVTSETTLDLKDDKSTKDQSNQIKALQLNLAAGMMPEK
ncbi:hypothetical protein LOK49_LG13G00381 [Camellia lanceoleosa]|uniref:Uncharacterized protein n=1 Tax=Camellia lanceoleosa TaxID=1840588 RepID=A0ACC0FI92_9ERIC|nr:hypothetical protein LOK49_LG13G00381 [Camellia lanceoleosa]